MEAKGLKIISLADQGPSGQLPLAEIDPFTFFSSFNRGITADNRRENWKYLKDRWALSSDVPTDFAGIPVVHNMKSWFFPYAQKRDANHVSLLWQLFGQAALNTVEQIDAALFHLCAGLPLITTNKLTIGLFWINPDEYLPADRNTKASPPIKASSNPQPTMAAIDAGSARFARGSAVTFRASRTTRSSGPPPATTPMSTTTMSKSTILPLRRSADSGWLRQGAKPSSGKNFVTPESSGSAGTRSPTFDSSRIRTRFVTHSRSSKERIPRR
jgi:hypothetical protein